MNLEILQQGIESFAEVLKSRDGALHQYKYEILENFRSVWTFNTDDFIGMYDRALQSDVTRRWWKRDNYRPKEMMLVLIRSEEQYAKQAFRELFNEENKVENRVDRFMFYADELLRMYKRGNQKTIENNHYQDSAMISLYLAGFYPDRYTLYPGRGVFNKALLTLHAKDTSEQDDLVRFFKVSKTLHGFLMKNASIRHLITAGIRPSDHLLLTHELVYFLADKWSEASPV